MPSLSGDAVSINKDACWDCWSAAKMSAQAVVANLLVPNLCTHTGLHYCCSMIPSFPVECVSGSVPCDLTQYLTLLCWYTPGIKGQVSVDTSNGWILKVSFVLSNLSVTPTSVICVWTQPGGVVFVCTSVCGWFTLYLCFTLYNVPFKLSPAAHTKCLISLALLQQYFLKD